MHKTHNQQQQQQQHITVQTVGSIVAAAQAVSADILLKYCAVFLQQQACAQISVQTSKDMASLRQQLHVPVVHSSDSERSLQVSVLLEQYLAQMSMHLAILGFDFSSSITRIVEPSYGVQMYDAASVPYCCCPFYCHVQELHASVLIGSNLCSPLVCSLTGSKETELRCKQQGIRCVVYAFAWFNVIRRASDVRWQ